MSSEAETKTPSECITASVTPDAILSVPLVDRTNTWKEYLCIERMHPDAVLPSKNSPDDAGYDLHAFEHVIVPAWGKAVVSTKIKVALQPGTYGRISSRSGLSVKHDIEVGAGVIDKNYQGEIMVVLRNFSDLDYQINARDRIAQLIISPYKNSQIKEVKKITDLFGVTNRGANGFGSSGK